MSILIVARENDIHAGLVGHGLSMRGIPVRHWFSERLPGRATAGILFPEGDDGSAGEETPPVFHRPEEGSVREVLNEPPVRLVWYRRPHRACLPEDLDPEDRRVAEVEFRAFLDGLWHVVAPRAVWINPLSSWHAANNKPHQLRCARVAGLRVPETLCSNDPDEIRAFHRRHLAHGIVYKTFLPQVRVCRGGGVEAVYTAAVRDTDLATDEPLRLVPGIWQRRLRRGCEVRVTLFGRHHFAIRYLPRAGVDEEGAVVDRRLRPDRYRPEPHALDRETLAACRALMRMLELEFGCIDLFIEPDGRIFFLEINEMGQFLNTDFETPGLKVFESFCAFLASRSGRRAGAQDFPCIRDVVTDPGFRAYCRRHGFRHPVPGAEGGTSGKAPGTARHDPVS